MGETVLVTGGSGYVAGWCVVELLRRGYAVRATLRDLSRETEIRAYIAAEAGSTERLSFVAVDLDHDEGWEAAMAGCAYVLHVASPLGGAGEDFETLVGPARGGALRVLMAATGAGVRRIVMTSSCAAATPAPALTKGDSISDETVWTDVGDPKLTPYRRSKAASERAAWDWMNAYGDPTRLTTILPAAIFGPVLTRSNLGSVGLIDSLLKGRPPGVPRVSFNVVDVRDLADLHIRAMTAPEAGGQRFIAAGQFLWMADVAKILRQGLGVAAAKVPRWGMPDAVVRLLAVFAPPLRALVPIIGRRHGFSSAKAASVLGFSPRPARETILECGASLVG